jgi:hypothetical protein
VVRTIDMASQPLVTLQRYLDPRWENQLFGSLTTRDPVSIPENARAFQSISVRGALLDLRYATIDELTLHRLQSVFVERGFLTVRTVIPLAAESLAVGAGPGDSLGDSYATCVLRYRKGDMIQQRVHLGDSVRPGTLLARVDDRGSALIRLQLEEERERLLVAGNQSRLDALERQISSVHRAAALDSAGRFRARRLAAEGLSIAPDRAESSRTATQHARRLAELLQRRGLLAEWFRDRLRKQDLDSLTLHRRIERERLEGEVRSAARGVVADIRRTERSGMEHLTFIIRISR